jgi:hypothetical protein
LIARVVRSEKSTPAGAATDFCSGIFIEKDREKTSHSLNESMFGDFGHR